MDKSLVIAQNPRILIVDDDQEVAQTINKTLRRNYQVFAVHSGIAALKEARRHHPDLMILDVDMPGLDGIETCQQLRSDPVLAAVPILFLSAMKQPEDRVAGFKAGADDYVTKPFHVEELSLRVEAILRRTTSQNTLPSENTIQVNDLVLDRSMYHVTTRNGEAVLTPMEFNILHHLMIHPGEVFTSDRLLQEVWDYPAESGSPDLVRMHIKNLREKIEVNPRKPEYILTIPRRGYTVATT